MNFTIVKRRATPLLQVGFSLFLGLAGIAVAHLIAHQPGREFFAAFVAIIFFVLTNVVISIAFDSYLRYTIISYYLYILLVVVLLLTARFVSGISIWSPDMNAYRMMLISISIFYLIASHLIRGVKAIYEAVN